MRPFLVGENNPYSSDPSNALLPQFVTYHLWQSIGSAEAECGEVYDGEKPLVVRPKKFDSEQVCLDCLQIIQNPTKESTVSEKSENQLERIAKAAEALVLGLHALTDLLAQKVDAVETPKKSHKKKPEEVKPEEPAAPAPAAPVAAAAVKEEPKPEPKKEDPKPAPAAAKAKDAGDFPAGAERPIRWAHTRTEFLRHVQKVGQEKAIELLGRYAAKKLSDVAEDKWPALVAECQGKPAPAAAPSPDDLV